MLLPGRHNLPFNSRNKNICKPCYENSCSCVSHNVSLQLKKPGEGEGDDSSQHAPADVPEDICNYYDKMDRDDEDEIDTKTVSFEINQHQLESLQKRFVSIIM